MRPLYFLPSNHFPIFSLRLSGKAPHLFEVTPDKKVVWTYANHKDMRTISSVQILDEPADPVAGTVQH